MKLFAYDGNADLPLMGITAVFEKKNTLPGAQCHPAIDDGNDFTRAGESHANMTGHIVRTFVGVDKPRRVFRHQFIKKYFKIPPGTRICIFHDDQTGTGVADKHRYRAMLNPGIAHDSGDLACDLGGSFSMGAERKAISMGGHFLKLQCLKFCRTHFPIALDFSIA